MHTLKAPIIVCLLVVAGQAAAATTAKPQIAAGPGKQIGPAFIPTFPDVECQAGSRRPEDGPRVDLCTAKTIQVEVRLIPAEGSLPSFCIAYMPYNKLILRMGKTPGSTTEVTWSLDPSSIYRFADTGIGPAVGSEDAAKKLLDLKPISDPKRVTVSTKADAPDKTEVHHFPLVVAAVDVGKPVPCVGIDPIIINNAD